MPARFEVAFSLAGEQRSIIEPVANELRNRGRAVFFYGWAEHQAELAAPNMDQLLRRIYRDEARLVIPLLSADYERKPWTGAVEYTVVRELLLERRSTLMTLKADDTDIDGFSPLHGYLDVRGRTTTEIADLIELRLSAQRSSADEPHRPTKSTDVAPGAKRTKRACLPGLLVAESLGRLQYWRFADTRQTLLEVFRETALQARLFPEMKISYRQRGGEHDASAHFFTIVTGPAGAGKTSYVGQLTAKLIDETDLAIVLRGANLAQSGVIEPLNVCDEIRHYFQNTISLQRDTRLPLAAVAHALNRRRVLIVIEDLHHAGPAFAVLKAVRMYMQEYHRWGPQLHVVATTREAAEPIRQSLGEDARIIALQPFMPAEAQRFFFDLGTANGLMAQALTTHGEALSSAFKTEGIRTPLFVVICAWLVSPKGGGADIVSVLRMTASEVFDTFIRRLFSCSTADKSEYEEFRDFYERLALSLWPQWEDCRLEVVEEQCRALGDGRCTATVEFMERNGFVRSSHFHGLRLQFPHQSMADYLTACALVRHRGWEQLSQETILGRIEGLVPFLVELIRDEDMLLDLASANFGTFLEVVDGHARRGKAVPLRRLVSALCDFALAGVHRPPLAEAFTRIQVHVAGRIVEPWVRTFATVLSTIAVSPDVIETLAIMGSEANDTFRNLLLRPATRQEFISAAGRQVVRDVLTSLLSDPSQATWRAVCRILLELEGPEGVEAVRVSLTNRLAGIQLEEVSMFRQTSLGTQVLAEATANAPLESKQRISALCVKFNNYALIPRGVYEVNVEGEPLKVRINQSFLVPALAKPLPERWQASDDILRAMRRQFGEVEIMTERQARVVFAYFGYSPLRDGVMFAKAEEDVSEVFRTVAREVGRFVIPSSSKALQLFGGSGARVLGREAVQYRLIEIVKRSVEMESA